MELAEDSKRGKTRDNSFFTTRSRDKKSTGHRQLIQRLRTHERLFSVVVGRHLADRSCELGNLDLAFVVSLDAGEHDLALAGLEAVNDARDGTLVVQVGEENQLFVDEVLGKN